MISPNQPVVVSLAFSSWQEWMILIVPMGLWILWRFRKATKREWFYLLCVVVAIVTARWFPQYLIDKEMKEFRNSIPPPPR